MTPTKFDTIDDLLHATYSKLIKVKDITSGKRGDIKEILNYSATLNYPRCRLSSSLDRKLFLSKFAEFIWYLTGKSSQDLILPYIEAYNKEEMSGKSILGAYGPKIFGSPDSGNESQWTRAINQFCAREESKQVYIAISEASDYRVRIEKHHSPPCTIGLSFAARRGRLNMTAYMRSNDAYYGLPHDLFAFTMLQEYMAGMLNLDIGDYTHVVTSMHVYKDNWSDTQQYVSEGHMSKLPFKGEMPPMPILNDSTIEMLTHAYSDLDNLNLNIESVDHSYWRDICRLPGLLKASVKEKKLIIAQLEEPKFQVIAKNSLDVATV